MHYSPVIMVLHEQGANSALASHCEGFIPSWVIGFDRTEGVMENIVATKNHANNECESAIVT